MPYEAKEYKINDLFLEDNIRKYILPYYNLSNSKVTQIKFKDSDKQRAVYKIEHPQGVYCLKKVYFNLEELLFVYSAIEWLYRNDINVPRLLPSINGNRFVEVSKMLFILTPWIEGVKCSYDNIHNILESSINLSKMHKCTEKFIPIKGSANRKGIEPIYDSIQKHFDQMLNSFNLSFKYNDKFSKLFISTFDINISLAKLALEISSSINMENLHLSLCHGDYVNKNIIFENHDDYGKLWVIDFDKCKIDYCAHDISYFLRRLLKRDNTKWDLEIAINSLKNYENTKSLNLEDYKYILSYLAFPHKYWKISRDYYNNISKCNKNSFYNMLEKSQRKIEAHKEFILSFKGFVENKFKIKL